MHMENQKIKSFYKNKNILITGAAGSIGTSLTDRLLEYEPTVIRLLDNNETGLFNLRQRYQDPAKNSKVRFLLGDVRHLNRLQYALKGIDIVFHLASYKHVLECEYNPIDAIETNVTGTANVIQAAINNGVKKVIFTSTDKAANPSNTMGTTKLLAEKLMIAANDYGGRSTVFSCCRFGNVVGTSGSVIPLFKKQILQDHKITITNPEMTRFIISQNTAIELVLKTGILSEGGETFIFKMPVIKVGELADAMITKYGSAEKVPVGKKPGEKLYEEIMTEEEMSRAYEGKEMYVIYPQTPTISRYDTGNYSKVTAIKNSSQMNTLTQHELLSLLEDEHV